MNKSLDRESECLKMMADRRELGQGNRNISKIIPREFWSEQIMSPKLSRA